MELVKINEIKSDVIFSGKGDSLSNLLKSIEKKCTSLVFDVETKQGRADIVSLAHKVAKSKTALDLLGKESTAEMKSKVKIVDTERRRMKETLDNLRDKIRLPVNEFEQRESKRINEINERMGEFATILGRSLVSGVSAADLEEMIERVGAIKIDKTWQEFEGSAADTKARTTEQIETKWKAVLQHEKDQEELASLRQDQVEREEKEKIEKVKKEAKEKAEKESKEREEKAKKEKEEAERRAAKEKQDRIDSEKRAEEARVEAEKKAKQDKIDAEKRAEQAKKDAEKKAEEDRINAKKKQEQAVIDERNRIERVRVAEEEKKKQEEAKRLADKKHMDKIKKEVSFAISEFETPEDIVDAILNGDIPYVNMVY